MDWVMLIIAGLFETAWAIGLKYSEGFTKLVPSLLTIVAMAASVLLLGLAVRTIPIGTGYAVWVGIGALGAVVLGIVLFNEPATPAKLFFAVLLLASIVGLKYSA